MTRIKAEFYFKYGRSLYNKGDYQSAIEKLDKAMAANAKNAKYYYLCGMAYYKANRKNEALDDFTQSIALDPQTRPYVPRELADKIRNVAKP